MNRKTLAAVAALSAATAFGVEYKWTGAVSSDFAEAGNWLVKEDEAWVATETLPRNEYGYDDIVFDGDAAACSNMPILSSNYILRRVYFRTGGWTLTIAEGATLDLVHGNGGTWNGAGAKIGNEISIYDTSGSGLTNKVTGALHYCPACSFGASEGSILDLDTTITLSRVPPIGSGYGGAQMTYGFYGEGTIHLTGAEFYDTEAQSCVVDGPTIIMDTASGVALKGALKFLRGKIIAKGENMLNSTDTILLKGDATLDLEGHRTGCGVLAFGADGTEDIGADWTGSWINCTNFVLGTQNNTGRLTINSTVTKPIVFADGLRTETWRYGGSLEMRIADNPDLPVEAIFYGPVFAGRSGNNVRNWDINGQTTKSSSDDSAAVKTYGAIALEAGSNRSGDYHKVYIDTTVYVNGPTSEQSALGELGELTVKEHGVLRGSGMVWGLTSKKTRTFLINGMLAPGSVEDPSATLTLSRTSTKNTITYQMNSNSLLRIEPAQDGSCPQVVQTAGTFLIAPPEEGAEETYVAPKIVVSGKYAPAQGRHRVLTVTGALDGQFAPEVVMDFPKSSQYTIEPIYSQSPDGKTFYVDLRVGRIGMAIIVR